MLAKHHVMARSILEVVCCGVLCCVPLVAGALGFESKGSRRVELREPRAWPAAPSTIDEALDYAKAVEGYLNDHFYGRVALIRINSLLHLAVGDSCGPEVCVGENGWLFLKRNSDVLDEHRGLQRLGREELEAWVAEYARRRGWLQRRGVQLYLAIVPNKHSIYPEHLPGRYSRAGASVTDQLLGELRREGVGGILDLRPVVLQRKSSDLVFPRTNTHWTDAGSFVACQAIMGALRQAFPSIPVLSGDDLVFERQLRGGDLARLIALEDILVEPLKVASVRTSRVVSQSGDYREDGCQVRTDRPDLPKALFLCDSFVGGGYARKFLQEGFSESVYLHHRGMVRLPVDAVQTFVPDVVVYTVVERLIPYSLHPFDSMVAEANAASQDTRRLGKDRQD